MWNSSFKEHQTLLSKKQLLELNSFVRRAETNVELMSYKVPHHNSLRNLELKERANKLGLNFIKKINLMIKLTYRQTFTSQLPRFLCDWKFIKILDVPCVVSLLQWWQKKWILCVISEMRIGTDVYPNNKFPWIFQ